MSRALKHALRYARLGWQVLPIRPRDKRPLTAHGLNDSSADPNQIREWWDRWPNANVGVRTGEVSGFFVLDVDGAEGSASLDALEQKHGKLPETRTASTGGGGRHLFFKWPGEPIRNFNDNRIGLKLDVRGEGGYVVAPPSIHPSGREYSWMGEPPAEVATAPDWLIQLIRPREKASAVVKSNAGAAPANLVLQGERHKTLLSFAGKLRRAGAGEPEILAALEAFNRERCHPSKERKELERIARDASRWLTAELEWPPFRPIPAKTPVEPCNPEMLPPVISRRAADVAERASVPVDLAVAALIVALSAAIGRRIRIQPKRVDDWCVIPNLWGVLIAPPGSKKSYLIGEAVEVLAQIDKRWGKEFAAQQLEFESAMREFKQREKKGQQKPGEELPISPVRRRIVINDATAESMHKVLAGNPGGVLLVRDELPGWLGSLEKKGQEGSRGFWLETWNGDGRYSMSRIGRGDIDADSLCVSILGGVQPGPWIDYVSNSPDDGFVQRFQLLVWPDPLPEVRIVDRAPDREAAEQLKAVFENLLAMPVEDPERLRFSADAQLLYEEWSLELEKYIHANLAGETALTNHLAKYRSLMPALACIFELVEDQQSEFISLEATRKAAAYCEYLRSHAARSYNARADSVLTGARVLAEKLQAGEIGAGGQFTLRDVYRHGWTNLSKADQARAACEALIEHGWIRRAESSAGRMGRPTELFEVNPEALNR